MSEKPAPSFAPAYVALYPMLVEVARQHGYALAVHGSVRRDFDFIAAPWTPEASPPEAMIAEMCAATGGTMTGQRPNTQNPVLRAHGRQAWSIYLGSAYLDVSVMPPKGSDNGEDV